MSFRNGTAIHNQSDHVLDGCCCRCDTHGHGHGKGRLPAKWGFLVGIYPTVVCGIATLVRFPRSLDAWIPIGIAALLVALFFTVGFLLPMVRFTDEFIHLLFFGGMPLGILFLVRNVIRMKRTGFSLTVFAYHSGVWLGWMGLTGAIIAAPIT